MAVLRSDRRLHYRLLAWSRLTGGRLAGIQLVPGRSQLVIVAASSDCVVEWCAERNVFGSWPKVITICFGKLDPPPISKRFRDNIKGFTPNTRSNSREAACHSRLA